MGAVPGYLELPPEMIMAAMAHADWSPEQWHDEYGRVQRALRATLSCRDPWVILAGSVYRYVGEMGASANANPIPTPGRLAAIEQSDIEMLQALALTIAPSGWGPSSPGAHVRCWEGVAGLTMAFIRKQADLPDQTAEVQQVVRRARQQTLYYRNLFDRPNCEAVLGALLARCDVAAMAELGYPLSAVFQTQVRVLDTVMARGATFSRYVRRVMTGTRQEVLEAAEFFADGWPTARRTWRRDPASWAGLDDLRWAVFQMSEQAKPWIFTLSRDEIEAWAGPAVTDAIWSLALEPGALGDRDPEHFHLDNPIWSQPYIALDANRLFAPLAQLVFSFPFAMVERLMKGSDLLVKTYEKARADELEAQIEALLRRAMPDAGVHRSVQWKDDATDKIYENDVVAVLGNLLFVFEAKSGQIKSAARRGGAASLKKNFKSLFIEPGIQGWRLQDYLDRAGSAARLWRESDGAPVSLDLDKPKAVFRFSVSIEHFAGLTSARHHLEALGLIDDNAAWAPVLSLGELLMIEQILDTQISFAHYLSRRAVLENQVPFDGDEQDLLSLYLTNGLHLAPEELEGRRLLFLNADGPVRGPKIPRLNRREPFTHGIDLSPFWRETVAEFARDPTNRHRFDLSITILNQHPEGLREFERRIRRWRRGGVSDKEDLLVTRYEVAGRAFVLAVRLLKRAPDPDLWHEEARDVVRGFLSDADAADCAVFAIARKSRNRTFDGFSFFRIGRLSRPSNVVGGGR